MDNVIKDSLNEAKLGTSSVDVVNTSFSHQISILKSQISNEKAKSDKYSQEYKILQSSDLNHHEFELTLILDSKEGKEVSQKFNFK